MDYSRKISELLWNLPDKGERESRRSGRFSEREGVLDKITFEKGAFGVKHIKPSAFLDFCYQFDSNPFVCGIGKDNLLAKGEL